MSRDDAASPARVGENCDEFRAGSRDEPEASTGYECRAESRAECESDT